jgi:hypothetical protein
MALLFSTVGHCDFSQFFQLGAKAMTQWAFGPQLVQQRFGFREVVVAKFRALEQRSPAFRYFFFGQQSSPLAEKPSVRSRYVHCIQLKRFRKSSAGMPDAVRRTSQQCRTHRTKRQRHPPSAGFASVRAASKP